MLRFLNSSSISTAILAIVVLAANERPASACTNILFSKGASADGSVIITYNDGFVAGRTEEVERGYPETWLNEVVRARPDQFLLEQPETAETELPF